MLQCVAAARPAQPEGGAHQQSGVQQLCPHQQCLSWLRPCAWQRPLFAPWPEQSAMPAGTACVAHACVCLKHLETLTGPAVTHQDTNQVESAVNPKGTLLCVICFDPASRCLAPNCSTPENAHCVHAATFACHRECLCFRAACKQVLGISCGKFDTAAPPLTPHAEQARPCKALTAMQQKGLTVDGAAQGAAQGADCVGAQPPHTGTSLSDSGQLKISLPHGPGPSLAGSCMQDSMSARNWSVATL